MIIERKLKIAFVILFTILACITAILFCNISNAYAQESTSNHSTNQAIVADGEELDPYNQDRIAHSKIMYTEHKGHYADFENNTFHVDQTGVKPGEVNHYNRLDVQRDGKDFTIYYDFRGYLGREEETENRTSRVQYFYNSFRHEMYIIGFDNADIPFPEWNITAYDCWITVFAEEVKYDDNCSFTMQNDVRNIYLDTKITNITEKSFYNFCHLEKVDILGKLYEQSKLFDFERYCFAECGEYAKDRCVTMNMLKAKHMNHKIEEYMDENADWHQGTKIKLDD